MRERAAAMSSRVGWRVGAFLLYSFTPLLLYSFAPLLFYAFNSLTLLLFSFLLFLLSDSLSNFYF